jgi:hypothetical protein
LGRRERSRLDEHVDTLARALNGRVIKHRITLIYLTSHTPLNPEEL